MAENQVSKVIPIYVGLTFFNPTPVNLSIFAQGLTAFSVFGRLQSAADQQVLLRIMTGQDSEVTKVTISDADYLEFSYLHSDLNAS